MSPEKPESEYLSRITGPGDVRRLDRTILPRVAAEMRQRIIEVVASNGGHLGSNLGTVELTLALLYVYDLETDLTVWDVGHQAYPFKLLTGRQDRFDTLRKLHGLGGFLRRSESRYDAFDAGHGGTSISAAAGFAIGRALTDKPGQVVAIIGDGSMTAGMAFEGLNFVGHQRQRMTVILNDNTWGISPNVGALSAYLNRIITGEHYNRWKDRFKDALGHMQPRIGGGLHDVISKGQEAIKSFFTPGAFFEELGFKYVGPVDGHRIDHLIDTFENVRQFTHEPVIIHVVTQKGKGLPPAEEDVETWHSPPAFDPKTATIIKKAAPAKKVPSYTQVFSDAICELAAQDSRIVAITAAMEKGTGLGDFHARYPQRFFDVGMAEQHAVTFAAGLACEGLVPFVAIYSTFLQRAYDQIIHDVALTSRPVVFCMDRGGLVGADGPTHHGAYDLSYLRCIPNLVIMAPKDENELRRMLKTALVRRDGPSAIRYPRGNAEGVELDATIEPLPIGRGEVLREGSDFALFAIGKMVPHAMAVAARLDPLGVHAAVVNARFAKPVDHELVLRFARSHGVIVTLEENVVHGGFGSAIAESLAAQDLPIRLRMFGLPDAYVDSGEVSELWAQHKLDADSLCSSIHEWLVPRAPRRAVGRS